MKANGKDQLRYSDIKHPLSNMPGEFESGQIALRCNFKVFLPFPAPLAR